MRICILLILLFFNTSCGYRMVGVGDSEDLKYSFYIEEVISKTNETEYYSLMMQEVSRFFNSYSMLKSREDADFNVTFIILDATTSTNITSKYEQAVSSDMNVEVTALVKDKSGKIVYENNFKNSKNFIVSSDISKNVRYRDNAFREAIRDLLLDFKYEFENR